MDKDFLVALRLQQEIDKEALVKAMNKPPAVFGNKDGKRFLYEKPSGSQSEMSLVDQAWEFMDPNPDVHALFLQFNDRFFWGKLAGVEVRWSPRMTLCAGLCCYEGRGGLCSVRLSQPLLNLRPRKDLIETLLHEMIHAFLFVTANNRDHDAHGPEFHKHMYRINAEAGTGISVYHNFHDEVDHLRQHWWRCDGVCRTKPPYFGYVKRSMNRAPHPRDPWWPDHQQKCGGTYTKVKEPENYKKKQSKDPSEKNKASSSGKPGSNGPDIRNFFGGKSDTGTSGTKGKGNPSSSSVASSSKTNSQTGVISGFSDTQDNLEDDDEPIELFPGQGFSLEKEWRENKGQTNKLIRKLPGIGVIECDRPAHQALPVINTNGASSDKNGLKRNLISCDSDSDTDDILNGLRSKGKSDPKRRKVSKGTPTLDGFLNITPGKSKKVGGFKSVCNSTDSEFEMTMPERKKRSGSPSFTRRPVRARDMRAIDLGSDSNNSSESDDEEGNKSLSSIFKPGNSSNSGHESSPDHKTLPKTGKKIKVRPSSSGVRNKAGVCDDEVVVIPDDDCLVDPSQSNVPLVSPNYGDPLRTCPSCSQEVKESQIHSHLDLCLQMI